MLFKYHKEYDSLYLHEKDKIIDIIKLIVKRPFYSFFFYQIKSFADDIDIYFEDRKWIEYYDRIIDFLDKRSHHTLINIIGWTVAIPLVAYFGVFRFFFCFVRWHKYYRESSLILLKLS